MAGFPMYDFADLQAANDAVWQVVAARLAAAGHDVPVGLDRSRTVDQLWQDPALVLAQSCGYPLLTSLRGRVRLVATPRYRAGGCAGAWWGSALVVRADDASPDLATFRGRRCAANQPHSNTGMNLLRAAVAELAMGQPFFRTVTWTGSHRGSLALVADGGADLAAIDAVTLAHLGRIEPERVGQTRILGWTAATPGLPFVTARDTDDATVDIMRAALDEIASDPAHAWIRGILLLDGFDPVPEAEYECILALEQRAIDLGYPQLV
ncbi:phosphate/phosphite/phosphonate ABC transporter substrate-binding protein [Aliidongia sp.]|uniref:phosphate/phosphite/phosphonate ABC transporter substrate-binding protein n=1 Tax=Aliidongia sp. TaxID=1914230 RepID=UPI002DDCD9AF|nr:PhnD/SsuA/transferrin family substrate-binding protein [Aliidongia sp.]